MIGHPIAGWHLEVVCECVSVSTLAQAALLMITITRWMKDDEGLAQ